MDTFRVNKTVLSHENSSRLFWLGRYSERVFTSAQTFTKNFDSYFGHDGKEEFTRRYCFDEGEETSIFYALMRAYDNAIVLRDEIGTQTFSYIQMAVYEMNKAKISPSPLLGLQKVIDNIAAFWGMADDSIEDERVRGIIKLGKRIERVDLYARTNAHSDEIRREVRRLSYRLAKTGLKYDTERLTRLNAAANDDNMNLNEIIKTVNKIINFTGD